MSRTDPQFNLRIPAELKEKVESAARHAKRSATAEIISRLEYTFREDEVRQGLVDADIPSLDDQPPEHQMLSNLSVMRVLLQQVMASLNQAERIHDQQTGLASHTYDEASGDLIKNYEKSERDLKQR